jgi:Fe-S cluster assembly protein SufB
MSDLYTEKVLDHFRNPRNMGKMENPDGVGKVGNPKCGDVMVIYIKVKDEKINDIKFQTFGCIPKDEEVTIDRGYWEKVSNTPPNLINRYGNCVDIKKRYVREYNGKLLEITPFVSTYNSFMLTPTHPVLAIKRGWMKKKRIYSSKCTWLNVDKKELLSTDPYYVDAYDLSVGDYLVFPYLNSTKDDDNLSNDFLKLLGYYLSEGYFAAKGGTVAFAFNKNEAKNIKELESLILKVTGKNPKIRIRNNVAEVYVCSRSLVRYLYKHGGKLAKNKKMSEEIMKLPAKKQWNIFLTYLKGDGNIYKRRPKDSYTYRVDTVSRTLVIQMQQILARNGIFASIKKFKKRIHTIEGRTVKGSDIYNLSFKLDKKHKFVKKTDKYFLVPIRKIQEKHYKGNVYNFEVNSEDHSYLVKGFAVHNCTAAIATSSITTELVKGKTINEVSKLTRDDVAKELGGLPALKMHCSNLAADALKEAIKDYRNKNKK